MSNPSHRSIVNAGLPRRLSRPGSRWNLGAAVPEGMVDLAVAHLAALERGDAPPVRIFKRSERKVIFAFDGPQGGRSFVAKVAWLHTWRRMLKYRQFALNEAANLILAKSRGLPVTGVEAVGHLHSRIGLPRRTVLIVECLEGYRPADVALRDADPARRGDILLATLPVFESLFHAACLHMDVNAGNVMLPDAPTRPAMLLDLVYATFADRPSGQWLMSEAGWFARSCIDAAGADALRRWLDQLLERTGLAADAAKWRQRFDHYRSRDWSRAERRAVRPF